MCKGVGVCALQGWEGFGAIIQLLAKKLDIF